jgi:hypothetical protein
LTQFVHPRVYTGGTMKDLYAIKSPLEVGAPIPWVSKSYTFLSTKDIVDQLASLGWRMVGLNFRNPFSTHEVRLEKELYAFDKTWRGLGVTPQIVFSNSFDGSSSARAGIGVFRQVCSNGLVAWTNHEKSRSRHNATILEWSEEIIRTFESEHQGVLKLVQSANKATATSDFRKRMAFQVMKLRNLKKKDLRFASEDILVPSRRDDEENTVWNVFNIAQEKAVRGFQNWKEVRDPAKLLRINLVLWGEFHKEMRGILAT